MISDNVNLLVNLLDIDEESVCNLRKHALLQHECIPTYRQKADAY